MKELIQMAWGSSLYGFTNDKSDIDYVIICDSLDDPELEKYKDNSDIEIFNKEQFQKVLDSHNIKALGNYIFTRTTTCRWNNITLRIMEKYG